MAIHLAARLHAGLHGLFRSSHKAEAEALYESVRAKFGAHKLLGEAERDDLLDEIALQVIQEIGVTPSEVSFGRVRALVGQLADFEGMWLLPAINWHTKRSVSEWWDVRDALRAQEQYVADLETTLALFIGSAHRFIAAINHTVQQFLEPDRDTSVISISTPLSFRLDDVASVVEAIMATATHPDIEEAGLFPRVRARLTSNLIIASGGNPKAIEAFTRTPVTPTRSPLKDPIALTDTYLANTPLLDLFGQTVPFTIPTSVRYEHSHIIGGTGHGKTQTLQYLIAADLPVVAKGERSIVVVDSQGDLIRTISQLKVFSPGEPLHDRLVLIDPSDVEWPVSLNMFDVGIERLEGYEPLERERLTNSILELYDFVLGSLLSAEMTQKQNVIFRYVTRLMLHIPDATIHTLRELMEPDSHIKFAPYIEQLSGSARHFFETEFDDREFKQTRKQVLRRLWGILENQTFERMFSHPKSKLDLFSELNAGKVILINTAKDLLKEQGSQIFGRFFIALIAQAAQERATLPEAQRRSTFVYIDEAAEYFDRNISTILATARKYRVGMVLAHQYLGQLTPQLFDAFAANTSIKLAGGVSNKDARALASMFGTDAEQIERQPKGSFATAIRGHTRRAVPLAFPLGYLEREPMQTSEDMAAVRQTMRKRYAVPVADLFESEQASTAEVSAASERSEPPSTDADVSTEPGSEW